MLQGWHSAALCNFSYFYPYLGDMLMNLTGCGVLWLHSLSFKIFMHRVSTFGRLSCDSGHYPQFCGFWMWMLLTTASNKVVVAFVTRHSLKRFTFSLALMKPGDYALMLAWFGRRGHSLCTGAAVVGGKHLASRISERTVCASPLPQSSKALSCCGG